MPWPRICALVYPSRSGVSEVTDHRASKAGLVSLPLSDGSTTFMRARRSPSGSRSMAPRLPLPDGARRCRKSGPAA